MHREAERAIVERLDAEASTVCVYFRLGIYSCSSVERESRLGGTSGT